MENLIIEYRESKDDVVLEKIFERLRGHIDKISRSFAKSTGLPVSDFISVMSEELWRVSSGYDDEKYPDFYRYINMRFRAVVIDYTRSRFARDCGRQLLVVDQDYEYGDYNPALSKIDILADVESEILASETATLLAEGDRRKKLILLAWKNGFNNDSQLAEYLADKVGGNKKSLRVFIQRFRTDCQRQLATAV